MNGNNIFATVATTAAAVSLIDSLDPIGGYLLDGDPRKDGEYTSDGLKAITLEVSVGTGGRGNAVLKCTAADCNPIADLIDSFDPAAKVQISDDPVEAVRQTLRVIPAKDGTPEFLGFKCSLRPNTREIKVPWSEREAFVTWLRDPKVRNWSAFEAPVKDMGRVLGLVSNADQWLAYNRSIVAEVEADQRSKTNVSTLPREVAETTAPTVQPTDAGTDAADLADDLLDGTDGE